MFTAASAAAVLLCGLVALLQATGTNAGHPNLVMGDDLNKPAEITPELLCVSCHAVFDVVQAKLKGKRRSESTVDEAMEGICKDTNFRVYKFIPPTMAQGCTALIEKHGDDVEAGLADDSKDVGAVCGGICGDIKYESPLDAAEASLSQKKKLKKKKKKKSAEKKIEL